MEFSLQETKLSEPLRELEETVQDKNYVRAVTIAETIGKPAD